MIRDHPLNYSILTPSRLPKRLAEIKNAPKQLFYKGMLNDDMFSNTIGVVGSRNVTNLGMEITTSYVKELVKKDFTIVSGLMYGVDLIAHKTALANNGKTIAVLAYGINYKVPYYANTVYNSIIENGGLIFSEYHPNSSPKKWTFVKRNRLISGFSDALLVTEAGENSGALYAAKEMQVLGRPIYLSQSKYRCNNYIGLHKIAKIGGVFVADAQSLIDKVCDIDGNNNCSYFTN